MISNVGKPIINHPFGNGLYMFIPYLSMVIWSMVYYWFTMFYHVLPCFTHMMFFFGTHNMTQLFPQWHDHRQESACEICRKRALELALAPERAALETWRGELGPGKTWQWHQIPQLRILFSDIFGVTLGYIDPKSQKSERGSLAS